jgi:hypothetical protein
VTSNVTYSGINENFPVAGQDNDTQVFRDNFATIKTGLRNANEELTDLQDHTAKINLTNDFEMQIQERMIFKNCKDSVWAPSGTYGMPGFAGGNIDYTTGTYQVWSFDATTNSIVITNLPGDPAVSSQEGSLQLGVGKLRLELYNNDNLSSKSITFTTSAGTVIKRSNFPAAGTDPLRLNLTLDTAAYNDPVIIDVWRHSSDQVFFQYIGQFS